MGRRMAFYKASTLGFLVAVAGTVGGCSDHRISISEFLQLQQQMRAHGKPVLSPEASEASAAMLDRQLGPYRVGPSDVLSVTLTGADSSVVRPPIQTRVDSRGEIELPVVGAIRVANMVLEEVEDAIRSAYVPAVLRDVAVYVDLVMPDTTNVLVVGSVTSPGLVPLRRTDRNMLYAIVGAGGVSDLASGTVTLRRIRRPNEEVTLDLRDPVQLNAALALDPLEEGDIVYVDAARPNTIFVGGLVNRPAPQSYPQGTELTILQALAAAGGVRTDVIPREGTLIRRLADGSDVHVKLNLDRLASARDPNIVLIPGDILWVPETLETKIQDFINRNIFLRAGVTATYSVTGIEFMNRRQLQLSRFGGGTLEDSFDPFGFLTRGSALQGLSARP
ncbi:MAG: polysaccharide biosynthesis/export family protein [Planctomycetes bacterium]|nr:polysaccharide biosynthesis/export family protein [Planctomycetota bacterium]